MKLALQLTLATVVLVLGGALHAAARAWVTSGTAALALGCCGAITSLALFACLASPRVEDRDYLVSLVGALVGLALGLVVEAAPGAGLAPGAPPGVVEGAVVIAVALLLCARIGLRRGFGDLAAPALVRAATRSERGFLEAAKLLSRHPDALAPVLEAARTTRGQVGRGRAIRLLGVVATRGPDERARAIEVVAAALADEDAGDEVLAACASVARALAHPDLISPLRRATARRSGASAGDLGPALLEARAACGDLDVIDDLLAASDPERARDVARALGAAALPALSQRLGRAADDDAARLLVLVGALPGSDEAYALAAARAGADAPPKVRAAALRALAGLDPRRAAPLAREALGADDLMVRTWAQGVLRAAGEAA